MRKPIVVRRWEILAAFLFNVFAAVAVTVLLTGQIDAGHRQGAVNRRQIAVNHRQIVVNSAIVVRLCHVNGSLLRVLQVALAGPRPHHLTDRQKTEIRQLTRIERSLKRERCRA